MLIWNKVNPSIDSYFTNTLDGTRNDNILKAEQNEIMDLVNNHNKNLVLVICQVNGNWFINNTYR